MSASWRNRTGPSRPSPRADGATNRASVAPKRVPRYAAFLLLLAALSTFAGYQVACLEFSGPNWFHGAPSQASTAKLSSALVPASESGAASSDLEAISHLAPQEQAERLLVLAIHRPDQSLGLIHKNLDSWRGHLRDTDRLFHLVLAALDSDDPRVRVAAVEIDLVANNLKKSPQGLAK